MHAYLNFKPLKSVYNFSTKTYDSINNNVHHGEKQPHQ